jgi:hypothetical protein
MWDHKTGRSKGYGFVSLHDHQVLLIMYAGIYWRDQPMNHTDIFSLKIIIIAFNLFSLLAR